MERVKSLSSSTVSKSEKTPGVQRLDLLYHSLRNVSRAIFAINFGGERGGRRKAQAKAQQE